MAKRLDKQDIVSLNIVRPYHVSQSVDAFTGIVAYDINVSGSFQVTGSTILSGSTYIKTLTDTAQTNILTINPTTGQLFYTASSAVGTTTNTGSLLVTASYSSPNLVFTKGNGTTFNVPIAATIDTSSFFKQGGNSFSTTATLGTNDNQSLQFETNGTTKMFISSSGNVGIGTTTPTNKFHVQGAGADNYMIYYTGVTDGDLLAISGNHNIPRIGMSTTSGSSGKFAQLVMGVRSTSTTDETSYSRYGSVTDGFISTTLHANGLNIYTNNEDMGSTQPKYIRFYAGRNAKPTQTSPTIIPQIPDIHIQGSGSNRGYVGINNLNPTAHLHVSGSLLNGNLVTATGTFSHAEGALTLTSGIGSHAEGYLTTASGHYSHAEGYQTIASGSYSHAEGQSTVAYGTSSHAEGGGSVSSGKFAHAEGFQTTASNEASHAEGWQTAAIGSGSHASGYQTTAVGNYSYAGGANTIASGSSQTVVGSFNTHGDTTSKFIVGGGANDGSRSDAFKVTNNDTIVVATQSVAPAYTGVEGEMVPVNIGGTCYLYVYLGGGWKRTLLTT